MGQGEAEHEGRCSEKSTTEDSDGVKVIERCSHFPPVPESGSDDPRVSPETGSEITIAGNPAETTSPAMTKKDSVYFRPGSTYTY